VLNYSGESNTWKIEESIPGINTTLRSVDSILTNVNHFKKHYGGARESAIYWLHLGRNKKQGRGVISKIEKAVRKIKKLGIANSYQQEVFYYLLPYQLVQSFKKDNLTDYVSYINDIFLDKESTYNSPFLTEALKFTYGYSLRQFFMLKEHSSSESAIAESVFAFNKVDSIISKIQNPNLQQFAFLSLVDSYYHSYDSDIYLVDKNVPDELKKIAISTESLFIEEYTNYLISDIIRLSPEAPAPDFTLTSYQGDSVSLSDLRGKYVYLDFWFSRCGPCIKAMEELRSTYLSYGSDVVFVSINGYDDFELGKKIADERSFIGVKLHAGKNHPILRKYNVNYWPTYYLISPTGKILYKPTRYYEQEFDTVMKYIN
ncbi:MAG: TlpA disulfide reductase family protein, partial [Tunicatimonas sp.]|uniref:TlpA family protein disulfide reductase n=1 Tax=Tunicatimonas sp. TaxID=1940096 RepID=UPI003C72CB25